MKNINLILLLSSTFLISSDFFPYLRSCSLFIGTGVYDNFSPKVRYLRLCNTFYSVGDSQFHNEFGRFAWHFWLAKSVNSGFLASSCERNFKDTNEFLSQTKLGYNPTNILKIGYLGLDSIKQDSIKLNKKQDSIIILSLINSPFIEILSECIELCLNAALRVVYKTHNGHLEFRAQEREFAQKWADNPNFIFYEEPNLSEEECARALCVAEFRSSMLYSFCLKNFKPAIVLSADSIESSIESIESKNSQSHEHTELFSFFEPNLHISAKNPQELLKIALKLKNSAKFRKQWQNKIEKYTKEQVFNYKNASAAVADFALKFLKAQSVLW